jgi:hypothetical protein
MAASDYASKLPKIPLASLGASTDGKRTFVHRYGRCRTRIFEVLDNSTAACIGAHSLGLSKVEMCPASVTTCSPSSNTTIGARLRSSTTLCRHYLPIRSQKINLS